MYLFFLLKVNYNDGVEGSDDTSWQENVSNYNSDFSGTSDDEKEDDVFDNRRDEPGRGRRRKGPEHCDEKDWPLPPLLTRVGGNMEVNCHFSRFYCKYAHANAKYGGGEGKRPTNFYSRGSKKYYGQITEHFIVAIIYAKGSRLQLITNVHRNGNGIGFNFVNLYIAGIGFQ